MQPEAKVAPRPEAGCSDSAGEPVNSQSTNASCDVFGIGWVVHDSILLVPAYPAEDTKTEAVKEDEQVGGPVVRALSLLSHLGCRTALGAVVGSDESGAVCRNVLKARGVAAGHVQVVEGGRTRHAQVWVSFQDASRTNVYTRGSLPKLDMRPGLMSAAERSQVLHLDGRELQVAVPIAARMRELGKTVVVDAGGWKPNLESLLRHSDILIVSLRTLGGASIEEVTPRVKRLRDDLGLRSIIVSAGKKGAWVLEGDNVLSHVPTPAIHAVNTNGAGDVFAGGLIYGLLKGWELMASARFASGVAALKCEHFTDFFPNAESVSELLAKGGQQ
jgi:sulfofructose kinase